MNAERKMVYGKSGELFIETPPGLWKEYLELWRENHAMPCPMPLGHMMFKEPGVYGMFPAWYTGDTCTACGDGPVHARLVKRDEDGFSSVLSCHNCGESSESSGMEYQLPAWVKRIKS